MKGVVNHLDLFSGIGGFALAAQRTWKDKLNIVGFCEIEPYAQKVLNKNFPNAVIGDVCSSTFLPINKL